MSIRSVIPFLFLLLPGAASAVDWPTSLAGWWFTPDQQGQRLFEQERYREAAESFQDPSRKGVALFRAGDFDSAAAVFGRISTAEAAYNRGNALVMLGRYEEAIDSYELALERRPGWAEADENRAMAAARLALLAPPETDAGGTGGMLEADEIVFDDSGRVRDGGSEVETEGGESLSEEEMRSVWLRRVQSDPADFLRSRFAYQLYRQEQEQSDEAPDAD